MAIFYIVYGFTMFFYKYYLKPDWCLFLFPHYKAAPSKHRNITMFISSFHLKLDETAFLMDR